MRTRERWGSQAKPKRPRKVDGISSLPLLRPRAGHEPHLKLAHELRKDAEEGLRGGHLCVLPEEGQDSAELLHGLLLQLPQGPEGGLGFFQEGLRGRLRTNVGTASVSVCGLCVCVPPALERRTKVCTQKQKTDRRVGPAERLTKLAASGRSTCTHPLNNASSPTP